jgi:hypothetical protein
VKFSNLPYSISLSAEARFEQDQDRDTKDNDLFTLSYRNAFSTPWYLFASNWTQRDEFKDLRYLINLNAGVGYTVWKSERKNLSLEGGPSYTFEQYKTPMQNFGNSDEREYSGAYWSVDVDIWILNQILQWYYRNFGVIGLHDSEVWQTVNRTGIRVPLGKMFLGSLAFNDDYVNSPADDKERWDRELIFKLGVEWEP